MRISDVTSTELFGGTVARPLAIVRVTIGGDGADGPGGPVTVRVEGPAVTTPEPAVVTGPGPGRELAVEVGVEVAAPHTAGSPVQAMAIAEGPGGQRAERAATVTTAEPGWTMWMVSHFHYDPVWWSTQGQFTESRIFLPEADGRLPDTRTAFELVRLHLDEARRDPDYKFVLAEIDYLKPHFDAHPEDRADLLAFITAGRIEIVGGSYNEPNTNLTSAESTIRNAVYGLAFQRGVLGADPSTAWMLDAFGHDPGYPGLMAAAGLTESAWAGARSTSGARTGPWATTGGCSSRPSSSGCRRTGTACSPVTWPTTTARAGSPTAPRAWKRPSRPRWSSFASWPRWPPPATCCCRLARTT